MGNLEPNWSLGDDMLLIFTHVTYITYVSLMKDNFNSFVVYISNYVLYCAYAFVVQLGWINVNHPSIMSEKCSLK
jgi:hypothetical protein